jgi:hypothetical protein
MPKPAYIVCSQSQSLDQHTNLLSVFHLIEGFDLIPAVVDPAEMMSKPTTQSFIQFVVNAAWMQTDGDQGQEYYYEVIMRSPEEEDRIIASDPFVFTKLYQRFSVVVRKSTPWMSSGLCRIENRIRHKDSDQWLSQEYFFPVTVRDQTQES